MPVDVLVGLQWGSEGKGKIASLIGGDYHAAVRSGGPNSGHTVWYEGKPYVTRHVPSAWTNPTCALFICAGAAIDLDVLKRELAALPPELRVAERLTIDHQAVLISKQHVESESALGLRISSTAHGVGAAYVSKLRRGDERCSLMGSIENFTDPEFTVGTGIQIGVVSQRVGESIDHGASVLIEGSQGTLLSLDHGSWPFVTSRNVTAAGLIADVGVGPRDVRRVIGIMRSYPIRVGGPSGPLPNEIEWEELSIQLGREITPEKTTVTGKVRRIAKIDFDLLEYASSLNSLTEFWITFADYLTNDPPDGIPAEFMHACLEAIGAPLAGISWGPQAEQSRRTGARFAEAQW